VELSKDFKSQMTHLATDMVGIQIYIK
jgi:hypothetical protein